MITRFKIFESANRLPEVGDYVIIDPYVGTSLTFLDDFFNTNIGIIENVRIDSCKIYFENVPSTNNNKYNDYKHREYHIVHLKYWSDNKEDLMPYIEEQKMKLDSNKYNL